jgi:hypothetical protein
MEALAVGGTLSGKEIRVTWGRKPANAGGRNAAAGSNSFTASASNSQKSTGSSKNNATLDEFLASLPSAPPPPGVAGGKYASMDPSALGSRSSPRESKE